MAYIACVLHVLHTYKVEVKKTGPLDQGGKMEVLDSIDADGLKWCKDQLSDRQIADSQVALCRNYLVANYVQIKKPPVDSSRSSYHLKHLVEEWAGQYISNGALIKAGVELGIPYKENYPNCYFAITKR